jgi:hypothetical protein
MWFTNIGFIVKLTKRPRAASQHKNTTAQPRGSPGFETQICNSVGTMVKSSLNSSLQPAIFVGSSHLNYEHDERTGNKVTFPLRDHYKQVNYDLYYNYLVDESPFTATSFPSLLKPRSRRKSIQSLTRLVYQTKPMRLPPNPSLSTSHSVSVQAPSVKKSRVSRSAQGDSPELNQVLRSRQILRISITDNSWSLDGNDSID